MTTDKKGRRIGKRAYPLRKVIQAAGVKGEYRGIPFSSLALLECGHKVPPSRDMYAAACPVSQRCPLCYDGIEIYHPQNQTAMKKEELEYSISQAIMILNNPSATKLILKGVKQYANLLALEVAGEAWDAAQERQLLEQRANGSRSLLEKSQTVDRETFLSNLKKKLDDKAQ